MGFCKRFNSSFSDYDNSMYESRVKGQIMTREEAKAKHELARDGRFGEYRRAEMLNVIDEMFDEWEKIWQSQNEGIKELARLRNRTCNTCKWFNKDNGETKDGGCRHSMWDRSCEYIPVVTTDFSCNKWEEKK